jgi:hypothetical protein
MTLDTYYQRGYSCADGAGERAGILMHEGQHGIDERALGHNPENGAEERATEHNASSVQFYVSKALMDISVRGLFQTGPRHPPKQCVRLQLTSRPKIR